MRGYFRPGKERNFRGYFRPGKEWNLKGISDKVRARTTPAAHEKCRLDEIQRPTYVISSLGTDAGQAVGQFSPE